MTRSLRLSIVHIVFGFCCCCVGMLVHKPKRTSATLQAFIDSIALSGLSLQDVAHALGYGAAQFAKILRGEPSHKLDIERFEGRLPYVVAMRFFPKLAEIALLTHMQQSADVLNEKERAS